MSVSSVTSRSCRLVLRTNSPARPPSLTRLSATRCRTSFLILTKQGDNILLADKRFDITNDVINGLNKRYKPAAKKADEKADEKK